MNKEEILEKSRQSNKDEGMEYAANKGYRLGFIVFSLLFAFLIIFNLFFGETSTFHALSSLFWAFMAAAAYEKNRFIKKKVYLITTISGCIASLASLANYIIMTLR